MLNNNKRKTKEDELISNDSDDVNRIHRMHRLFLKFQVQIC